MILACAEVPLAVASHQTLDSASGLIPSFAFGLVGFLVARRQPRNALGWLMLAGALASLLSYDVGCYAALDYRFQQGHLPLGTVAAILQLGWIPAVMLLPVAVILFPDGHAPSSRWASSLRAYAVVALIWSGLNVGVALSGVIGVPIRVDPTGQLTVLDNPTGAAAVANGAAQFMLLIYLCFWLAWVIRLIGDLRSAEGQRRQQIKWFMAGAAVGAVGITLTVLIPTSNSLTSGVVQGVGTLALAAIPACLGVAILRYRLYDIDRLISRTLAYLILTALLAGVYVALVFLATRVLPFSSPIGVAAGTLAAVGLFSPLRRRVQRLVDRRFNRRHFDAEVLVQGFARRLRDEVDVDGVWTDLAGTIGAAVEPTQLSLWITPGQKLGS